MKRGLVTVALVGAVVLAFALGRAQAQDGDDAAKAMQEAMMKAWKDLGTPGPQHAELKKMEGNWTADVKSWHAGPDAEPTEESGKCTYKMTMNGLILEQNYQGSMMGEKFTGRGFTAFNKATGKWESLWMDSMSSGMMFSVGEQKDGFVEFKGHFFGPGGAKVSCRYELYPLKDDQQKFVMYMDMGMGMQKSMEMTYKRVKE